MQDPAYPRPGTCRITPPDTPLRPAPLPEASGRGFYSVDYREETCDCPDHEIRQENCKHILAVVIYHAKHRRRPHACYDGVVYIGHLVEDPGTGEEVEVIEAVPCRCCNG